MEPGKPYILEGVDINRPFTAEEILELHASGRLRNLALKGYCTRADLLEGTLRFIPWYESSAFRQRTGTQKEHISYDFVDAMREDVERNHPMKRRTPQEKVASMMLRLMAEVKKTGTITGLSQEHIRSIAGESRKEGEPLPAEAIRKVAAHYLGRGEKENKEADSHRVTQAHALA